MVNNERNTFEDNFQVYFCDDEKELMEAYFRDFHVSVDLDVIMMNMVDPQMIDRLMGSNSPTSSTLEAGMPAPRPSTLALARMLSMESPVSFWSSCPRRGSPTTLATLE